MHNYNLEKDPLKATWQVQPYERWIYCAIAVFPLLAILAAVALPVLGIINGKSILQPWLLIPCFLFLVLGGLGFASCLWMGFAKAMEEFNVVDRVYRKTTKFFGREVHKEIPFSKVTSVSTIFHPRSSSSRVVLHLGITKRAIWPPMSRRIAQQKAEEFLALIDQT